MKATYNKNAKTKFTNFHRKESKCFFNSFSVLVPDDRMIMRTIIDLRIYGTGNTNTAAIWINDSVNANNIHTSGTGSAGGYGYDRESAAAGNAIENAGFELSERINGVGRTAIYEALDAIAEYLGYKNAYIHHAHQ